MKFEEDIAFNISRNSDESIFESIPEIDENQQIEIERENNIEPSSSSMSNHENSENVNNKKRPLWARKLIEENQVEPNEVIRESKRKRNQSCYVALLTELIKTEPSNVKEAL